MDHLGHSPRLRGYEVYRFGAAEFDDESRAEAVTIFFDDLLERHT